MKTMKQYHQQANPGQRSLHTITMFLIIMAMLVTGAVAAESQQAPGVKEPARQTLRSPYAGQSNAAMPDWRSGERAAVTMVNHG